MTFDALIIFMRLKCPYLIYIKFLYNIFFSFLSYVDKAGQNGDSSAVQNLASQVGWRTTAYFEFLIEIRGYHSTSTFLLKRYILIIIFKSIHLFPDKK